MHHLLRFSTSWVQQTRLHRRVVSIFDTSTGERLARDPLSSSTKVLHSHRLHQNAWHERVSLLCRMSLSAQRLLDEGTGVVSDLL